MDKIKNSFVVGVLLGLTCCGLLMVVMDAVIYFVHKYNGVRGLDSDVVFAICTIVSLVLARKFFRTESKQELGKGFLFASFIWGGLYVFLFLILKTKSLLFIS